jgi:hypothetical protein
LLKRALLVGASLAAAFGLAEILVRAAAGVSFDVKYLATAGAANMPRQYKSFEDLLHDFRSDLVPHRSWYNYYANALGFLDREFVAAKPKDTMRIMALGDSFAYGSMAYPQNVLPLTEANLRARCGKRRIELMNFGIPATGVWEYRLVHRFAAPIFKPETVVVHFYMGNDGPDLITGASEVPSIAGATRTSFAWNFLANSWKLLRSVDAAAEPTGNVPSSTGAQEPQGGRRVSDQADVGDGQLSASFTPEVFSQISIAQIGRLYAGKMLVEGRDPWKETLDVLDALRAEVVSAGEWRPIIVLFPSELQVDPQAFEATKREITQRFPLLDPAGFDPGLPNQMILAYCRRAGIACHDTTPALIKAAAEDPAPLYKPRDTHWNVRGNRVAAQDEAAFLAQQLCQGGGA